MGGQILLARHAQGTEIQLTANYICSNNSTGSLALEKCLAEQEGGGLLAWNVGWLF